MDKATQEKLLANVKNLNEKYRSKLPDRLAEIQSFWSKARENLDDDTVQKNFYRVVHSLAGSAGTFGFAEVGASARLLLNSIKEWQNEKGISNVLIEQIEIRMNEFEQVVQTACNEI